jgi:hypothetical protein
MKGANIKLHEKEEGREIIIQSHKHTAKSLFKKQYPPNWSKIYIIHFIYSEEGAEEIVQQSARF